MNDKQLKELKKLLDYSFEAVKIDCDARNWNGHGKKPEQMTKEERGGRYFDMKNADKSISIYARLTNIIDAHEKPVQGNTKPDDSLKDETAAVTKEAAKHLKRLGLDDNGKYH